MDLTRDKRQADQKIEELQGKLALHGKMTFKQPFYFQEGDNVPFCPRCFEKDKTAVHLFLEINRADLRKWECRECKSGYRVEGPDYHRRYQVQGSSDPGPWS